MRLQIKYFLAVWVRAFGKGFAEQVIGGLHSVLPVTKGNVQPKSRELRVRVSRGPDKSRSSSIDPGDGVLGPARFAIAVDDVQMRGVDAFAVGIFFEIFLITGGGFRAAPHPQQR